MSKKSSEIDRHSFDTRLSMVEQILPTLPTKAEMSAAIAPLATRAELVEQLDASSSRLRVLIEDARGDTRLLADSVLSLHNKVDLLLRDKGSKTSR